MNNTNKFELVSLLFILILLSIITVLIYTSNAFFQEDSNFKKYKNINYYIYSIKDAKGVIIWLHGDGAYEFKHPNSKEYLGGEKGIKEVAKQKKLTLIVPKTPSDDSTWWTHGDENSENLINLINKIPHHENLWICGFSGGSEITTYWLINKLDKINIKRGGAILFGGGGSPKNENIVNSISKEKKVNGKFPLTWLVGENDTGDKNSSVPFNAIKSSKEGFDFYKSQGWEVQRFVIKGYGHLISRNNRGLYGIYIEKIMSKYMK